MAANLLSDARVRSASFARDGLYLPDGGGLRIRLLKPSANHPKGARLAEFHFKLKQPDGTYRNGALHLGTIGDPFTDAAGKTRPFTLSDARQARDAARELVAKGIDPREAARLADAEAVEAQRARLAAVGQPAHRATGFRQAGNSSTCRRNIPRVACRTARTAGKFVRDLFERHIFSTLGDLPLEALRQAQRSRSAATPSLRRVACAAANMALSLLRQFARWCMCAGLDGRRPHTADVESQRRRQGRPAQARAVGRRDSQAARRPARGEAAASASSAPCGSSWRPAAVSAKSRGRVLPTST